MAITIYPSQLPVTSPIERDMRWNCEEYCIAYNRTTRVLTVEDFEGFEDDGSEITTVITDADQIKRILEEHKPGWPSVDGFTLLLDYYGEHWTIGTTPV